MKKSRILVVDDHPMVRDWLAQAINREPDLTVCGQAANAAEALLAMASLSPDMAIVDLTMSDSHGTELVREIASRFPHLPVLVLSMHDESLYADRAIRAGARGYITKQEPPERIKSAIRRVLGGGLYLSDAVASKLLGTIARRPADATSLPIDSLSQRQLEILRLTGQGLTTQQIAAQLRLGVKTVEGYSARIKTKLGLANVTELRQYAIRFNKTTGD